MFSNHAIVQVGAYYYDPSYGLIYDSADDFQGTAVAGFYLVGVDAKTRAFDKTVSFRNVDPLTTEVKFIDVKTLQ